MHIDFKKEELKSVKNIFTFLYDKISEKNFSDQLEGNYYVYKNTYRYNLFQLFISYSDYRCWFLTDTPIAILCINLSEKEYFEYYVTALINLEMSLLETAGLTIVVCCVLPITTSFENFQDFLISNEIAEVHYFVYETQSKYSDLDKYNYDRKLFDLINEIYENNDFIGYFYLYIHLLDGLKVKPRKNIKIYNFPKFKFFTLSEDFNLAFNFGKMSNKKHFTHESNEFKYIIKEFPYCSTGFESSVISSNLF